MNKEKLKELKAKMVDLLISHREDVAKAIFEDRIWDDMCFCKKVKPYTVCLVCGVKYELEKKYGA